MKKKLSLLLIFLLILNIPYSLGVEETKDVEGCVLPIKIIKSLEEINQKIFKDNDVLKIERLKDSIDKAYEAFNSLQRDTDKIKISFLITILSTKAKDIDINLFGEPKRKLAEMSDFFFEEIKKEENKIFLLETYKAELSKEKDFEDLIKILESYDEILYYFQEIDNSIKNKNKNKIEILANEISEFLIQNPLLVSLFKKTINQLKKNIDEYFNSYVIITGKFKDQFKDNYDYSLIFSKKLIENFEKSEISDREKTNILVNLDLADNLRDNYILSEKGIILKYGLSSNEIKNFVAEIEKMTEKPEDRHKYYLLGEITSGLDGKVYLIDKVAIKQTNQAIIELKILDFLNRINKDLGAPEPISFYREGSGSLAHNFVMERITDKQMDKLDDLGIIKNSAIITFFNSFKKMNELGIYHNDFGIFKVDNKYLKQIFNLFANENQIRLFDFSKAGIGISGQGQFSDENNLIGVIVEILKSKLNKEKIDEVYEVLVDLNFLNKNTFEKFRDYTKNEEFRVIETDQLNKPFEEIISKGFLEKDFNLNNKIDDLLNQFENYKNLNFNEKKKFLYEFIRVLFNFPHTIFERTDLIETTPEPIERTDLIETTPEIIEDDFEFIPAETSEEIPLDIRHEAEIEKEKIIINRNSYSYKPKKVDENAIEKEEFISKILEEIIPQGNFLLLSDGRKAVGKSFFSEELKIRIGLKVLDEISKKDILKYLIDFKKLKNKEEYLNRFLVYLSSENPDLAEKFEEAMSKNFESVSLDFYGGNIKNTLKKAKELLSEGKSVLLEGLGALEISQEDLRDIEVTILKSILEIDEKERVKRFVQRDIGDWEKEEKEYFYYEEKLDNQKVDFIIDNTKESDNIEMMLSGLIKKFSKDQKILINGEETPISFMNPKLDTEDIFELLEFFDSQTEKSDYPLIIENFASLNLKNQLKNIIDFQRREKYEELKKENKEISEKYKTFKEEDERLANAEDNIKQAKTDDEIKKALAEKESILKEINEKKSLERIFDLKSKKESFLYALTNSGFLNSLLFVQAQQEGRKVYYDQNSNRWGIIDGEFNPYLIEEEGLEKKNIDEYFDLEKLFYDYDTNLLKEFEKPGLIKKTFNFFKNIIKKTEKQKKEDSVPTSFFAEEIKKQQSSELLTFGNILFNLENRWNDAKKLDYDVGLEELKENVVLEEIAETYEEFKKYKGEIPEKEFQQNIFRYSPLSEGSNSRFYSGEILDKNVVIQILKSPIGIENMLSQARLTEKAGDFAAKPLGVYVEYDSLGKEEVKGIIYERLDKTLTNIIENLDPKQQKENYDKLIKLIFDLWNKNIAHGDLNQHLGNAMTDLQGNIKFIDFGLSAEISKDSTESEKADFIIAMVKDMLAINKFSENFEEKERNQIREEAKKRFLNILTQAGINKDKFEEIINFYDVKNLFLTIVPPQQQRTAQNIINSIQESLKEIEIKDITTEEITELDLEERLIKEDLPQKMSLNQIIFEIEKQQKITSHLDFINSNFIKYKDNLATSLESEIKEFCIDELASMILILSYDQQIGPRSTFKQVKNEQLNKPLFTELQKLSYADQKNLIDKLNEKQAKIKTEQFITIDINDAMKFLHDFGKTTSIVPIC
jgi:hypothetical protein